MDIILKTHANLEPEDGLGYDLERGNLENGTGGLGIVAHRLYFVQ